MERFDSVAARAGAVLCAGLSRNRDTVVQLICRKAKEARNGSLAKT
jgi:hypothetical protein